MAGQLVQDKSRFRFAAFAGVMLLVSGLVITLFDEARAAEVQISVEGTLSGTSATVTADVVVPTGQKLPLASVTAVIESNPSGNTVKTEDDRPVVEAVRQCDAPIEGCPTVPFDADESIGTGITSITFDNVYLGLVGTGYTPEALGVAQAGYFSACPCPLTRDGGYGYGAGGVGYGYGGALATNPADENAGDGYGYVLGADDLILRFTVLIDPSTLPLGDHWFTFVVDTGSGTLGELSSIATKIITAATGGGGGGGGGGGPGPGGPTPGPITVTAGEVPAPAGATAAFRTTVTAQSGQSVIIQTDSDFLGDITFVPSGDLTGATIDIVHWPAETPPPGVGTLPPGLDIAGFVQITVSTGGETHQVTIAVTIPPGQAGDPSKAVLLKWDTGANKWQAKGRITLTQNADGSLSGEATSDCCSDFAVAFDETDPEVSISVPQGTLSGAQTITATASDNLELVKVDFFVDDQLVGTDNSAPYSLSVDTADFENGEHTVRAVATDFVGNTAESSQTSSFENEGAPGPGPGDGKKGDGPNWFVIVLIIAIIAVIGAAGYYFWKKQQGA